MDLYQKHRPVTLDDVVGQPVAVASVRQLLADGGVPHVLLFSGPSGCGKTTLARILQRELECSDLDWHEINSASFRGIDTVRQIQDDLIYRPVSGRSRIWLIDEAHQVTGTAQEAMLKILEDMPRLIQRNCARPFLLEVMRFVFS